MVPALAASRPVVARRGPARSARPLLALGLTILVVGLLGGSVPDVTHDHRLLVAVGVSPALASRASVLVPGGALPLDLTVSNPYAEQVLVTRLDVVVTGVDAPLADPTRPCGLADFTTTPGRVDTLLVAARSSTTLAQAAVPAQQWPSVGMTNADRNQDGCRRASVRLDLQVWGRAG